MMTPLDVLQRTFGYKSFRLKQEAIIKSVLQGKDTFALMPTGAGKSLCYQVPGLMLPGLTLVISPLIALMKDQVDQLCVNGIEAAFLGASQDRQEQEAILVKAKQGSLKFLYLSPERLLTSAYGTPWIEELASADIRLIAIDEAHCISQWGHDFRPEYGQLAKLRVHFPKVPILALTATADRTTQKDILEKLEFKAPSIFISSFNRPNICYHVAPKANAIEQLIAFLQRREDQSGIVYCLSRKSTEAIAGVLNETGFSARAYHAGLERDVRIRNQERFQRDEVKIIVATIAFGMGINKSNVRYVVHMDVPKSIENYYQETGRAGRDGLPSDALLLYSKADVMKLKKFVVINDNPEQTAIAQRKLDAMSRFCECQSCRRKYLLSYFDETTSDYCGTCDHCLSRMPQYDATPVARLVLKAVLDVKEQFGAGYIIHLLSGSSSQRISAEHRSLSTFGSAAHLAKHDLHTLIYELITQGYLQKTESMYPILNVTAKGRKALQHQEPVFLNKPTASAMEPVPAFERSLLNELKEVRRKLAADLNVPSYIVVSDATLQELATFLPASLEEMRKISGFGEIKLQRYGHTFLAVVQEYCAERELSSRITAKAPKRAYRERIERDNETKQKTLQMFLEGVTPDRIAEIRKLSISTIESHLAFYVQQGKLPLTQLIPADKLAAIRAVIEARDTRILSAIKETLGEGFSFGEIKYVIADGDRKAEETPWSYGEELGVEIEAEIEFE